MTFISYITCHASDYDSFKDSIPICKDRTLFASSVEGARLLHTRNNVDFDPSLRISHNMQDALLMLDQGQFLGALDLLKKNEALFQENEIFQKSYALFHVAVKAHLLVKVNRYKEALIQIQNGLDGVTDQSSLDREQLARLFVSKALAQNGLKMYAEAEASAQEAITLYEADFGKQFFHRPIGLAHMALGVALAGQNRYTQAKDSYDNARYIFAGSINGFVTDDTSELLLRIYELGMKEIDTDTGRKLVKYAVTRHKTHFKKTHHRYIAMTSSVFISSLLGNDYASPTLGIAHMVLGDIFMKQEQYQAAYHFYENAWGFFTHLKGEPLCDRASDLLLKIHNLGMKQIDKTFGEELMQLAVSRHEQYFPLVHPGYMEIIKRTICDSKNHTSEM